MNAIRSQYSDIALWAMHKRALKEARKRYGKVLDKGFQLSVSNNGASLCSYYECDGGKVEMYSVVL